MSAAFDKEAIRQKYREERDKRLRADGNDQYIEIKDQLGHYLEDPYVEKQEREPLTDHVTVAYIGGGFSGLVAGAASPAALLSAISSDACSSLSCEKIMPWPVSRA